MHGPSGTPVPTGLIVFLNLMPVGEHSICSRKGTGGYGIRPYGFVDIYRFDRRAVAYCRRLQMNTADQKKLEETIARGKASLKLLLLKYRFGASLSLNRAIDYCLCYASVRRCLKSLYLGVVNVKAVCCAKSYVGQKRIPTLKIFRPPFSEFLGRG